MKMNKDFGSTQIARGKQAALRQTSRDEIETTGEFVLQNEILRARRIIESER